MEILALRKEQLDTWYMMQNYLKFYFCLSFKNCQLKKQVKFILILSYLSGTVFNNTQNNLSNGRFDCIEWEIEYITGKINFSWVVCTYSVKLQENTCIIRNYYQKNKYDSFDLRYEIKQYKESIWVFKISDSLSFLLLLDVEDTKQDKIQFLP